MKNFSLSLVTVLAMSTLATAGGDIAPVVEPVVEVVAPATDSGFYIGGAYSVANVDGDITLTENVPDGLSIVFNEEIDYDAFMLQAGYQYNKYLAIEGRYWTSIGDGEWTYSIDGMSESGDDGDHELTAWGIYVKPMYPVTEAFDVYALLGYGNVTLSDEGGDFADENGFQWGLGAAYSFTENLSVFVDYVVLYDDVESETDVDLIYNEDITVDTWNFGLTYKF